MKLLETDPNNLKFEFGKRWETFRDSPAHSFLIGWMDKRIEEAYIRMSLCNPEDLGKLQGQVLELQLIGRMLNNPSIVNEVRETIEHLERKYGK